VPLRAPAGPSSAVLATIAGPRAAPVTTAPRVAEPVAAVTASQGTGRGAVALSAGYRGRRRR
jgi:hypothetical protein